MSKGMSCSYEIKNKEKNFFQSPKEYYNFLICDNVVVISDKIRKLCEDVMEMKISKYNINDDLKENLKDQIDFLIGELQQVQGRL